MSPEERYLCHRGLDSNLALNTILCHLRAGGAVVFPESLVLAHFLEAVDRHAVTQLTLSPAFLRSVAEAVPEKGPRFPGLRLARIAGSSLPPALLESALERVTPNLASVYGLFEIGFVTFGGAADLRRRPESVGRVVDGVEAVITDEGGAPVARGTPGLLRLRRAGMPQGYFRNPEATAKAFRGGWFHTGDYARLDAEGMLHIGGRADDRMNLGGMKIEPAPIERALEEHPAVAEAAVFSAAPRGKERLYAAVVRRAPVEEKALLDHCRARVGEPYTPKQVFFLARLPRNEAGKLLRAELSRRVKRPGA
jgi:acyl-coenzyme A synthetase/AMP-(fatty) acid ligase